MSVEEAPVTPVQVVSTESAGRMMQAEVDSQVATAKRYPRSITDFMRNVETRSTVTEAVAAGCIYSIPRRDKSGQMKHIRGPSIRLAEIVATAWKNCRIVGRILDDSGEYVTAQGVFHDLENNVAFSTEVRRRITTSEGRRYSADMIAVTANAAAGIAMRNAILRGVPRAYWDAAFEKCQKVMAGSAETLSTRRLAMMDYYLKLGVTHERVLRSLELKGLEDITVDHLVTLKATATAIRDGDTTIEEAFPEEQDPASVAAKPAGGVAAVKSALAVDKPAPQVSAPASVPVDLGAKPAEPAAEEDPNAPRPKCMVDGCMKEQAKGSFYCEDHVDQPAKRRQRGKPAGAASGPAEPSNEGGSPAATA